MLLNLVTEVSSSSSPVMYSSDNEMVPESPLVTPPRSPKFMPISADRTAEIEFSEEFNSSGDEPEPVEENSEPSEAKSQPTAIFHIPTEIRDEITAFHLRLGQDEQRIAKLEQQIAPRNNAKRKWWKNSGGSSGQQPRKTQKTVNVCTAGQVNKNKYKGKKPHCKKCNRHHTGHCGTTCGKCKRYGHQIKDCRSTAPTVRPTATPGAPRICYECGGVGHYRNSCANLKNQNDNNKNQKRMSKKASM